MAEHSDAGKTHGGTSGETRKPFVPIWEKPPSVEEEAKRVARKLVNDFAATLRQRREEIRQKAG